MPARKSSSYPGKWPKSLLGGTMFLHRHSTIFAAATLALFLGAEPAHAVKAKCSITYTGQGLQKLVNPPASDAKEKETPEYKKKKAEYFEIYNREAKRLGDKKRYKLQDYKRCGNKSKDRKDLSSMVTAFKADRKSDPTKSGDLGCYCMDGEAKPDPRMAGMKRPEPEKVDTAGRNETQVKENERARAEVPAGRDTDLPNPGKYDAAKQQSLINAGQNDRNITGEQLSRLQTRQTGHFDDPNTGQRYNVYSGFVSPGKFVEVACPANRFCLR
jgi:hypothetical protein